MRKSHCRLLLQGFGHEPSDMRQVEKPCLQLGCCATVCDVVRGRACSTSAQRSRTRDGSKQAIFSGEYAIWFARPRTDDTHCGNVYTTGRDGGGTGDGRTGR